MSQKITEYEAYLAEVKTNWANAQIVRTRVAKSAQVALEMVEGVCKAYGWALPEPEGEPPLNDTGAFPAVPPAEVSKQVVCQNCGVRIDRRPPGDWFHLPDGFVACYPDGVVSTEAEPAADLENSSTLTRAATATLPDGEARTDG